MDTLVESQKIIINSKIEKLKGERVSFPPMANFHLDFAIKQLIKLKDDISSARMIEK